MRIAALWFLWIATSATAYAAAVPPFIGPSTSADTILSFRNVPEGALVLQYKEEMPGSVPGSVSIGIAADYHYIETSKLLTIYDYKLHRILTVTRRASFVNDSMFAEVWRRMTQLRNRAVLARLASGNLAQQQPAETSAFWTETELGMASDELATPNIVQTVKGSGVQWTLHGEPIAAVRYQTEQVVPPTIRKSLRRFWPTLARVHPVIADALAASGRMPAELWIEQAPDGRSGARMVHWSLITAHWDPAARYPLPPHLKAAPTTNEGLYPQMFATVATFVERRAAPPTQETYKLRVETAILRGHGLEAMLWLTEMDLARGPPFNCESGDGSAYCELWSRAAHLAQEDPRTSIAFADTAPNAADRYKFNDLPNAYVLQLSWAALPHGPGAPHAVEEIGLLAALKASPVANFCRSAGLVYASEGQAFAAWQLWDFGRQMAGHKPGDLLDAIDTLEAELITREPFFF
jgi:hypothetical protein